MKKEKASSYTGLEAAVIGMAGRFPGARHIHEFWDNLVHGRETIAFFTGEELKQAGFDPVEVHKENYVKAKGICEGAEYFDAHFFGYIPSEAEAMPPELRIFHECVWEGLEDAGYSPVNYTGRIGLYAGSSSLLGWEGLMLLSRLSSISEFFSLSQIREKDFLSTRISYKLGLTGPVYTLNTACSTSLAAVHLGVQALVNEECEIALAGGISISIPNKSGYLYQEGMVLSPDGHCRPFDVKAGGPSPGEGAGVVVLKRLNQAITDCDHIYAVIKATAVNNDGNRKVGFTAPSVEAQAEVIIQALYTAEVEPQSIGYLEAHGTGTPLGDPVEIEALTLAFDTGEKQSCPIGSVKSNIGHLDAAAGIAGLIKTVLALVHKKIPPTLHFETTNPDIDFANTPFYVNTELKEWKSHKYPLRAGVSSLGIGGTNAHIILEEAPSKNRDNEGTRGLAPLFNCQYQLILLSAKTQTALDKMSENLAEYLKENLLNPGNHVNPMNPGHLLNPANHENPTDPGPVLVDAAYTLQVGRTRFPYRRKCVCANVSEAIQRLTSTGSRQVQTYQSKKENENRSVVFIFPGLGSQYVNMGRGLYDTEPIFRQEMDLCFGILNQLGSNIKDILYPDTEKSFCGVQGRFLQKETLAAGGFPRSGINRFNTAQLAVFIFEYALAKLLMAWGIKPTAMIGYSFGEYPAACLSGVFSLEDALRLLVARGKRIARLPGGLMLSVPLPVKEVESLLPHELSIGIDNGSSCVVSGPVEAVAGFEEQMKRKKVVGMRLDSTHGIHSPMMDSILEAFKKAMAGIALKPPQIPYISTVTGNWIKSEDAVSPIYWARQLRETVRFFDGIQVLLKQPNPLFLEVGPGHDLAALVKRQAHANPEPPAIPLVPQQTKEIPDTCYLLDKIGLLWLYGVNIDWLAYHQHERRQRLSLPTYPFERKRFWKYVEDLTRGRYTLHQPVAYFYITTRKAAIPPLLVESALTATRNRWWLIFTDNNQGFGTRLVNYLEQQQNQENIITVIKGEVFSKNGDRQYVIHPANQADYDRLIETLLTKGTPPGLIVHLWGVTPGIPSGYGIDFFKESQDSGFYSLLFLTQSLVKYKAAKNLAEMDISGPSDPVQIEVVVNHVCAVTGQEELYPEKSTITALCKTIPQEYPNLTCRAIDIRLPMPGSREELRLLDHLAAEFHTPAGNLTVAYRGTSRWIQHFEPLAPGHQPDLPKQFRKKGVYLITGGLGRDSFTRARYLAKTFEARLVLVGRTQLPERQYWDQYLLMKPGDDETSKKIKRVQELEQLGAEVLVIPADVADESAMRRVMSEIDRVFGRLDGVVHAAGVTGIESSRLLMDLGKAESEWHFRPKVYGLYVLEKVLAGRDLDFCLLTSSVASMTGGIGLSAYTAASIFMDTFTRRHNSISTVPWLSLNWQGSPEPDTIEAFKRVLALKHVDQLVFSRIDPGHLIREKVQLRSIIKQTPGENQDATPTGLGSRPDLSTPYTAPRNELEQKLADIWQRFFGVEKIGVTDDLLDLGGDSLKAINILNIIKKELNITIPLKVFFDSSTIEGAARYIMNTEPEEFIPIQPAEEREYYPLSSSQKRLFILQRMNKESIAYNSPQIMELEGELEEENLKETFRRMIRRHESLRTSYIMINDMPVQRIYDQVEFNLEYDELRRTQVEDKVEVKVKVNDLEGTRGLAPLSIENFIRPFDLSQSPLFRCGLVKTGEHRYLLMIDTHHIITDAISNEIFIKEMLGLYAGEALPVLKVRYRDYTLWQHSSGQRAACRQQETFWLNQFSGEIPVLNLPLDHKRPVVQEFTGSVLEFQLDKTATRPLKELAARLDITVFMMMLAIYYVFLARVTGQEDIILGTPVGGRRHPDLRDSLGTFINTLALRNSPAGDKAFDAFLKELRTSILKAFENQEYPFEALVDKAGLQRDASRNPLFDVMLVHQNLAFPAPGIPGLKIKPYAYQSQVSKFDLALHTAEAGEKLLLSFEYQTSLFRPPTIKRFSHWLLRVIQGISADPGIRIGRINLLSPEEKHQLLVEFNDTRSPYPGDKSIHELFAEQVEQNPDQISLIGKNPKPGSLLGQVFNASGIMHLSYRESNEKAGQLGHLIREKGVRADKVVGIMMEHSPGMIVGILAILKAGGAYLPIDPGYPAERIKYMLDDSKSNLLVTTRTLAEESEKVRRWEGEKIFLEPDCCPGRDEVSSTLTSTCQVSSANLAYVIYTSGSSGRPKGVMVMHRNVIRLVKGINFLEPALGERLLMTGSIAFDISTFEIWGPLTNGLSLFLANRSMLLEMDRLAAAVKTLGITILHLVPQLFNQILAARLDLFAGLKVFLVGGDLVRPHYINELKKAYPRLIILHMYGPTENTTFSTFLAVERVYEDVLPIGRSISNSRVFILDKYSNLQPIGVAGELSVSGDGLARGYLNNPELTAEKFYRSYKTYIPKKIYKTGDLARWLEDGNIEFLGRRDHQVKIRGFRVELEEIEARLSGFGNIKEAVVIDRDDKYGERRLYAYIVPGTGELDLGTGAGVLRGYLSRELPFYMIPEAFIMAERIPLTSNGKVDRKALAALETVKANPGTDYVSPGDEVERQIASVWEEVLDREQVGRNDNFFEMGGNSLDVIRIVEKLKPWLGIEIPVTTLFEYPNLGLFSEFLKKGLIGAGALAVPGQQDWPVRENPCRDASWQRVKTSQEKQRLRRQKKSSHA